MSRLVASLFALMLFNGPAWAGVVITMEQTGGPDGAKRESQVFVEPDRLKMPQPRGGVIYRADQERAYSYDDDRKAYVEMSRESMGQMRQQMDAAMAQMRQQMAGLPPEQRKMVEDMMAKQGAGGAAMMGQPPGPPPTVTFEKAGGKQTIGKWSCEGYARMENGRKTDDMCIAKMADLGLTRADLKAFESMSAMFKSSMGPQQSGAAAMDFDAMSKAIGYDGAPVHTVHYGPNGKFESTIKAIERKAIPAATFDLPAGYAKQDMGRPPAR